jgi:WD40 repeat protein
LAVFGFPSASPPADNSLPPVDYSTFKPPAVGQAYTDPTFGTAVKRLTDSGKANLSTSEISYFSIDDSVFLAREDNATRLFDGKDGGKIQVLDSKAIQPWTFRWARGNYYMASQEKKIFNPAKHFYNIEGNEIRLYDLETMDSILLYKFPEYSKIDPAGGRGDLSQNGRYWVLNGTQPDGKQELFVYDLFKSLKGKVCPFDPGTVGSGKYAGVHFATVSPSWKYVVICWNTGSSQAFNGHYGVEVFDTFTWKFIRWIHPTWAQLELG